jgi:hypothetical protein
MSLIKECQICGNRISFRKMPHGKYVAFDVKTNDRHVHTKAEINKIKKIQKNEDQKEIEINKDNNKKIAKEEKISKDDFNQSEEFEAYEATSNEDIFKDDTVESLRNEIDTKVSEKKNNKPLIFAAVAIIIVLIFVFNK